MFFSAFIAIVEEGIPISHPFHFNTDDEFRSLEAVKRRLEAWKANQPDSYGNAYAADNVPAVFAPFVRNELLTWEPVFEDTPGAL